MATQVKQDISKNQFTVEEHYKIEQLKREAQEADRRRAIESLVDFKSTLSKYGISLCYRYDEEQGEIWYFEIEMSIYSIDFWDKQYNVYRPGRGGNNGKWYSYTDCLSLLNTIKLYFWEYKGIEVIPEIDLLPLLNTPQARNMQKARKW